MRRLLSAILLIFALASCSAPDLPTAVNIEAPSLSRLPAGPDYANNPFDLAGKLHYDILEIYIPLEDEFATMQSIISLTDSIALSDSRFSSLAAGLYTIPTTNTIASLLSTPDSIYTASTPLMSLTALTTSKSFCNDVVAFYDTNADYDDAYTFITSYEDTILSSSFTSSEKEIMLTTSSVARYSLWLSAKRKKRKPRDRDWDTLFTALTASIEGGNTSMANAIMLSVATAAVGNQ